MSQSYESHESGSTYNTPRWVKWMGIIALVLAVLIGIMLLSGGEHSPLRHTSPIQHTTQQP
jgi:hypothetical protein